MAVAFKSSSVRISATALACVPKASSTNVAVKEPEICLIGIIRISKRRLGLQNLQTFLLVDQAVRLI